MKRILPFAFLLCSLPGAFSQSTFEHIIKSPNPNEYLSAASVAQCSDNGFIIAGNDTLSGAGKMYLVKTDSLGYVMWSKNYQYLGMDHAASVEQTTDGGYIIGGYRNRNDAKTYIIKTNSSGDTLWTRVLQNQPIELSHAVRQTADGGYAIAGVTSNAIFYYPSAHLTKLDASGNLVFSNRYGGPGTSDTHWYVVNDFKQLPDKGFIMTGWTSYGAGSYDVLTIRTDSAGTLLWNKVVGGSIYDVSNSVVPASDGGFVVAGTTSSYGAGVTDVYFIKYDASGNVAWIHTYGGTDSDEGNSVVATADGGYMIAGYTKNLGPNTWGNVLLLKTDASGTLQWSKSFGTELYETGNSIVKASDGGYVVVGMKADTAIFQGSPEIYLLKLDSSGNSNCLQTNGTLIQGQAIGSSVATATLYTNQNSDLINPAWTVGAGGIDSMICQTITGIQEFYDAAEIKIYPNPTPNTFYVKWNISTPLSVATLKIYDVTGRMVHEETLHSSLSTVNCPLSTGLYLVRVEAGDKVYEQKVVVE